jgi:hypothetical protein
MSTPVCAYSRSAPNLGMRVFSAAYTICERFGNVKGLERINAASARWPVIVLPHRPLQRPEWRLAMTSPYILPHRGRQLIETAGVGQNSSGHLKLVVSIQDDCVLIRPTEPHGPRMLECPERALPHRAN